MAYDPTKPGILKATMNKIQSLLQAGVGDLNTALVSDADTSPIVSTTSGQPGLVLTSHILRGMRYANWKVPNNGALRIHVVPGNQPLGTLFSAQRVIQDPSRGAGYQYTVSTSIYCYVNPAVFTISDPDSQQDKVAAVLTTVTDWIRAGVFNNLTNRTLTLASTEYTTTGDKLVDCSLRMGAGGTFDRGFDDKSVIYGLMLTHEGSIR